MKLKRQKFVSTRHLELQLYEQDNSVFRKKEWTLKLNNPKLNKLLYYYIESLK